MEKLFIDQEAVVLLAQLLDQSQLTEIEYQKGDARIRVTKAPAGNGQVVYSHVAPSTETPSESPTETSPGEPISSPMVGTVYIAPEPGAPPFVQVGDQVQEGQTLFIIEAMKVMNPIRSPFAGKVLKIAVNDGMPVEFGELLLTLEKG